MKELLESVAKSLVEYPDDVVVNEQVKGSTVILELSVAREDMGKVIGRQGRIAKAIRTLIKAASIRENKRVVVEIM